ncbi:DUF2235 domain-containing protein [Trinickia sp. Y13]|uniref:T6SS phospholipase effector Tle1-like catalytic domain-containing protein n=1 Tax=Trinickia sp. Y13 TaxID=2917807 RepID=UPI00240625E7|nr:DUF2235 domain-containing protein [Trinickia sp. Y13]MDG0025193.1 DUF2235 domain-containing protein [Trinickia sp. Y13]
MSDAALRPDVVLIEERPPSELVARAARMANAEVDSPFKKASCTTDVRFAVFFDGTSNSMYDEDARPPDQQEYTNIAKLYHAHKLRDDSNAIYVEYLQGVGTKFAEIGDPGGLSGAATGYMGMERVQHAEKRLKFALDGQRSRGLTVNTVHVAVFGFSRGATLARAFVNRLADQSQHKGGQWIRDGVRLRIYFVGIFDTVASVGLPRDHNTYAKQLCIPPIVERCVHMVAGHELRFAFPLDSVRRGGSYPANTVEYVYPGVHSDVGGGYAMNAQGRTNAYARLPLHAMYREARLAGVPLLPLEDLGPKIQDRFAIAADLPARFRTYMNALETKGESLEEQAFGHLKLYWRWRRLRMNSTQAPIPQRLETLSEQAKQQNKSLFQRLRALRDDDRGLILFKAQGGILTKNQAAQLKSNADQETALDKEISTNNQFETDVAQAKGSDRTLLGEARALERVVAAGRASDWEKAIWEAWNDPRPLPNEVASFFDTYIHDSQAAWNHTTDAAAVALNQIGAAQTCGRYFNTVAVKYCAAVEEENRAGTVKYLRPRTLFFGQKEAVFAASDTNF